MSGPDRISISKNGVWRRKTLFLKWDRSGPLRSRPPLQGPLWCVFIHIIARRWTWCIVGTRTLESRSSSMMGVGILVLPFELSTLMFHFIGVWGSNSLFLKRWIWLIKATSPLLHASRPVGEPIRRFYMVFAYLCEIRTPHTPARWWADLHEWPRSISFQK